MRPSADPELDVRAMETALGHAGPERPPVDPARFEELAEAEAYWTARFAPLLDVAPPARPSRALWRRIAADTVHKRRSAGAERGPLARRLWDYLGLGPLAAFAATTASVIVAALVQAPQPALVAILQSPDGARPGYALAIAADRTLRLVPLVETAVPAGRALQFWTKADSDPGPTSLGLIDPAAPLALPFPGLLPAPGQLFEVTREPAACSPVGRPTGPVLFIGRAVPGGSV